MADDIPPKAPPPYENLPGYNPETAPPSQPQNAFQPPSPQPPPQQPGMTPVGQAPQAMPAVVMVSNGSEPRGNCPACKQGLLKGHYGCCAICLAIWFFPLGIICCIMMKDRKCNSCGYVL